MASIPATLHDPGAKSDLPAKLRAAIARVERQRPASKRSAFLRSAIAALESRAGSSLEVRIRQSLQTPMWIAGRVLEPRASGHRAALRAQATARSFLRHNRELLGIEDPEAELVLEGDEQDLLRQRHLRFAQRYRGLTVWPSELVVHLDPEGNVVLVNGAYVQTPAKLEVQPAITAEEAMAAARRTVPGGVPAPASTPELVVHAPLEGPPRLAWSLELRVSLIGQWRVIVDAGHDSVLEAFNEVKQENRAGSEQDLFRTTRNLNVWEEGGTFFRVDPSKPMFDPTSDPPALNRTRGGIL